MFARRHAWHLYYCYTLLVAVGVACLPQTATIDDADSQITYSPSQYWSPGDCNGCLVHLDKSQVFGGTWHETTYTTSDPAPFTITIPFTGTGIKVFNILANSVSGAATTVTNLLFQVDDGDSVSYTSSPRDTTDYDYNQVVFHTEDLPNVSHTLVVSVPGGQDSLVLFDKVVYMFDDGITDSPSPFVTPTVTTETSTSNVVVTDTSVTDTTSTAISTSVVQTTSTSPSASISTGVSTAKPATPVTSESQPSSLNPPSSNPPAASGSITNSSTSGAATGTSTRAGVPVKLIAGVMAGGFAALLILAIAAFWMCRRHARADEPAKEKRGVESDDRHQQRRDTAQSSQSDAVSEPNSASPLIHITRGTINPETLSRSSSVHSLRSQSRRRATAEWLNSSALVSTAPLQPLRRLPSERRHESLQSSEEESKSVSEDASEEPPISTAATTGAGPTAGPSSSPLDTNLLEQVARLQAEMERMRLRQEMHDIAFADAPPVYDPASAPPQR